MEMTEESWRSALGLSSTGEAATPTQTDTAGETVQETAEPAAPETEPTQSETAAGEESQADEPKQPQSREENARQAKLRREREEQARIDAAVEEARKKFAEQLKAARLPDPTRRGEYLETMDDLDAIGKARAMKNAAKALNESGELSAEQLTDLMAHTETGRAMLDMLSEAEAAQAEAEAAKVQQIRTQGINQIGQIDKSIKRFEDLQASPEYEAFKTLVTENRLSWKQAWQLAAGERLAKQQSAAERQRTLNNLTGKAHMGQDGGHGGEGIDLPASVEAQYRAFDPAITHEQALRKYADYLRRTGQS